MAARFDDGVSGGAAGAGSRRRTAAHPVDAGDRDGAGGTIMRAER
jgi:hypothetical protein